MLCATILSSQINCPILLTNKEKINDNIIQELHRLDTEVVYIIGGEDSISEKIIKTINDEHIYTDRIHGKDRYETSIKIAEKINILKNTDSIILVNGKHSVADAISISPIAGNKNIPVIMCKNDDLETQKKWIKDNNINNIYIVGGTDVINKNIEDYFYKEKIEVDRISGKDRYKTNAKVIKNFYTESKINKLFYCNGKTIDKTDEGIEAMLFVPLAAKEKSPIILLGEELIDEQRDAIKNKNIKSLVQVGNGVSEEAKKELYRLKNSYIPPQPPINSDDENNQEVGEETTENNGGSESSSDGSDENGTQDNEQGSSSEDESGDTGENGTTGGTELAEAFKYEEIEISNDKKTITITFNKDICLSDEDLKILKENIKIIIDENNIVNYTSNEEKFIRLNKYDNVKKSENTLIIELEEAPIGQNSYISINSELIKDSEGNLIKDENGNDIQTLRTDNINGENKKIAFVKKSSEFLNYINYEKVDIIKLESDIKISKNLTIDMVNQNNVDNIYKIMIDGSNGEENFKLFSEYDTLKVISMSYNEITAKNLDLEGIYIEILNNQSKVTLNNMNIALQGKSLEDSNDTSAIVIDKSIVDCKDLILESEKPAIEIRAVSENDLYTWRSTLTIDGYVYNKKVDEFGNYKSSIILENRTNDIINNSGKLNTIISKNEDKKLEDMYEINMEDTNEYETKDYKIYINYYKPKELQPIQN